MRMSDDKTLRWKNIMALISQKGEMSVKETAELLGVSEITIRRDLTEMKNERLVSRTHGGARLFDLGSMIGESYVVTEQSEKNAGPKSTIGLKAASLVKANETIFLDSGSTTPFIAKYIDKQLPITVLCYTFLNALEFSGRKNVNLILYGGFYHRDSTIFYNPEGLSFIRGIRADKAFISAAGIDEKLGLTTYFHFEVDMKKAMIQSAKQIILVVDSSKFGATSVSFFAGLDQVHTVVTDAGISPRDAEMLRQRNIEVIIAD